MGLARGEGSSRASDGGGGLHFGTKGCPIDAAVPAAAWVIMVAGNKKVTLANIATCCIWLFIVTDCFNSYDVSST